MLGIGTRFSWSLLVGELRETRNASEPDYQTGVLTFNIPKREEAKPKHIKVNVGKPTPEAAAEALAEKTQTRDQVAKGCVLSPFSCAEQV